MRQESQRVCSGSDGDSSGLNLEEFREESLWFRFSCERSYSSFCGEWDCSERENFGM